MFQWLHLKVRFVKRRCSIPGYEDINTGEITSASLGSGPNCWVISYFGCPLSMPTSRMHTISHATRSFSQELIISVPGSSVPNMCSPGILPANRLVPEIPHARDNASCTRKFKRNSGIFGPYPIQDRLSCIRTLEWCHSLDSSRPVTIKELSALGSNVVTVKTLNKPLED